MPRVPVQGVHMPAKQNSGRQWPGREWISAVLAFSPSAYIIEVWMIKTFGGLI